MSLYLICEDESDKLISLSKRFATCPADAMNSARMDAAPMVMSKDTAHIDVSGILEPNRVSLYDYYGVKHTAYSDIAQQTAKAIDDGAKSIQYNISSGGGNVEGMLPAMKSIKNAGVPTTAKINGLCASAAYMLASQCDSVVASSELDIVGSIGVVTSRYNFDFIKEITNTDSPNKRPDVKTEDGLSAIKEELDDIYGVVIPYVASARNTSIEKINSDWGKGGTMTAKKALSRGMIDMIAEYKPAGRSGVTKGKSMDREQLKAEHPDLYTAIFNDGKEAGKAEFEKMATSHMKLAEMSGDYKRAMTDVSEGNEADAVCAVYHAGLAQKKTLIEAREEEKPADISAKEEETLKDDSEDLKKAYAEAGLEVTL